MNAFSKLETPDLLALWRRVQAGQDLLAPAVHDSVAAHAAFGISHELSLQIEDELSERGVRLYGGEEQGGLHARLPVV